MGVADPLLLDLPMPIQTERLLLRPLMPGDGKLLFDAIEESREELKLWLPWVPSVKCWQDSERTARGFYADFIRRIIMNLAILHQGEFVGMCSLNFSWQIPSASIGYWCRLSAQGQGFIQEAISALTLYAFRVTPLKRLAIICHDGNVKSARVAENLGYRLELRAPGLIENLKGDELVWGRRYVRFDDQGLDITHVRW